jgi:autotransporter translocation and assembly factor TamB
LSFKKKISFLFLRFTSNKVDAFYKVLNLIRSEFPFNSSSNEIQTNLSFDVPDSVDINENDDDEIIIYDDDDSCEIETNSDANVEKDALVIETDLNVVESDSNVIETDSNLVESDSNVIETDSNLVESDSNVVEICQQLSLLQVKKSAKKTVFQTHMPNIKQRKDLEISNLNLKSTAREDDNNDLMNDTERVEFENEVKLIITGLDKSHQFPNSLSKIQRQIVHSLAEEAGLDHFSMDSGDKRFITIQKQGTYGLRRRK